MNGIRTGKAVIIPDESGVAEGLAKRLRDEGVNVSISQDIPEDVFTVIYLEGVDRFSNTNTAVAINKKAFRIATAISQLFREKGGIFVTVQRTGGDFGLRGDSAENVWTTGLAGLSKTVALEWPMAAVKAIDLAPSIETAKDCAASIMSELLYGGPEIEVGLYGDGRRSTINIVMDEGKSEKLASLPKQAVVLVSGGGRGVTAASMLKMAENGIYRFILLGRTELVPEPPCCEELTTKEEIQQALIRDAKHNGEVMTPAQITGRVKHITAVRNIRQTVAALEAMGSEAVYIAVDVQDATAIATHLSEIRKKWGGISVLVHGAGVLQDKLIGEKEEAQFDKVFNTKVKGLQALLAATQEDELKTILLFSSVVARTGNLGQSDYAMANEVLNKVAAVQRKKSPHPCLVRSMNWGPWDGGMVGSAIKQVFASIGVPLIPLHEGAGRFTDEFQRIADDNCEIIIAAGTEKRPELGRLQRNEWKMETMLHEKFQPYLMDHQVNGVVVLPVVMVLEWAMKFAKACLPESQFHSIQDLQMKKGVVLPEFSDTGRRMFLDGQVLIKSGGTVFNMRLLAEDGTVHYTVSALFEQNEGFSSPAGQALSLTVSPQLTVDQVAKLHQESLQYDTLQVEQWKWPVADIYDGSLLFHGPTFQVVEAAFGISGESIAARLKRSSSSMVSEFWLMAPDLLDGGLQLMRLWAIQNFQMWCLPTKVGSALVYRSLRIIDELFCIVHCRNIGNYGMIATVYFYDESGCLVAELRDVEGYRTSEGESHDMDKKTSATE